MFQIIAQKIGEVVQSPGFTQGLSSQQTNLVNQYTEMSKKFANPLTERLKDILGDISIDMESGKLTQGQVNKYLKQFERLKTQAGDVTETTTGYIAKQMERMGISDDRLDVITGEGLKGEIGQEIGTNIDQLKDKFKGLAENINKAGTESKNFFDELRKGGTFALARVAS